MHRHLNEELRTVSREEEIWGKVVGFTVDGFFCSGVLSTIGRSSARSPSLRAVTPRSPCKPRFFEGREKRWFPVHGLSISG